MNRLRRKLHDIFYAALIGVVIALAAVALSPIYAQPLASVDAQGLADIARSNQTANEASIAGSRASMCTALANSEKCTTAECHIAVKAIAALSAACGFQAASPAYAQAAPPAPVIVQAAPPQPEPHIAWRIIGGIGSLFGQAVSTAINNAPQILGQYAQMRLGIVNSNNQMALGIAQSNNGLAAQQSTNSTILGLGNGIVATADSGFRTVGGVANAFAAQPTNSYTFNGNGNQFAGRDLTIRTTTTTNTVTCPQTTQATGGNAAPGGQGGGAPGSNGGQSGNAAPPSTNPLAECAAGK
jgi:hypothetical protein